jgi:hypothetical protein
MRGRAFLASSTMSKNRIACSASLETSKSKAMPVRLQGVANQKDVRGVVIDDEHEAWPAVLGALRQGG